MDCSEFLQSVITTSEGHFCLALRNGDWREQFYKWPEQLDEIVSCAESNTREADVYFSSYLFSEASSQKQYVLPSKTIQQDLDHADVERLPISSSVLVRTSSGRHQGYWLLKEAPTNLEDHELLSKRMAYAIPQCDHSGWPLGRKVRLPGTINHKYLDTPQEVTVVDTPLTVYSLDDLDLLPLLNNNVVKHFETKWEPQPIEIGPHQLLESVREQIPGKTYTEYSITMPDRSKALWALMLALFRAGMNRSQVYYLAAHSANNKFAKQRYHTERDLMADVVRAELVAANKHLDARAAIAQIRGSKAPSHERKRAIQEVVIAGMKQEGKFLHSTDGSHYYVHEEQGRPLHVSKGSQLVGHLLDIRYGLNATEVEHSYVKEGLVSYIVNIPENTRKAVMTHYESQTNTLYVHSGKRYVYKITPLNIERINDGDDGLVFDWNYLSEQFTIDPKLLEGNQPEGENQKLDWGHELFGPFSNIVNMEPEEGLALLKVWLVFTLFRGLASSRPLLAIFGQPGSGKSTLAKRIYTFLYGRSADISAITNQDHFDHAVSTMPIVVLDNVDTYAKWIPDRLAQSLGNTDIVKRKLFTDQDTIVLRRRAMLIVTAHNPSFVREDVVDRLLIVTFERLKEFLPEAPIYERIIELRSKLWASLFMDIQRILSTPMPAYSELQLRVEDFARIGEWIARGIGCFDAFASSVNKVQVEQKSTNQETDQPLIAALRLWLADREKRGKEPEFKTADVLWAELDGLSNDPMFRRKYVNGASLGRKLWTLQETLGTVFKVEWKPSSTGGREWKIERHEEN